MVIHLLVQPNMEPLPSNITVVQNYWDISITTDQGIIDGKHMVVEGTEDAIKNWLRPFDGVWLGVGQPIAQEFEVVHISD